MNRKLRGLIEAIAEGLRGPGLQGKLDELEQRKVALEAKIAAALPPAPRFHPNLAEVYRRKVADLQSALADPGTQTETLEILRGLIQRDAYLACSILLIYCLLTIVGTLISDILLALIDPRIRMEGV